MRKHRLNGPFDDKQYLNSHTNYTLSLRTFNEDYKFGTENFVRCCLDVIKLTCFVIFSICVRKNHLKSPFVGVYVLAIQMTLR